MLSRRLRSIAAVTATFAVASNIVVSGRVVLTAALLRKARREYPELFIGSAAAKSVEQVILDTIKEMGDGATGS